MELRKGAEALIQDTVAVARFVGERAVGGAWGALATQLHETRPANIQVYTPDNVTKGEE